VRSAIAKFDLLILSALSTASAETVIFMNFEVVLFGKAALSLFN
jgi:hypothetical protein